MIEKLKNEVTTVKKKINIYLFELNDQIKLNNNITKVIIKFEKEENNFLKNERINK